MRWTEPRPAPWLPQPICCCRYTKHDPREHPDGRLWTWQITSDCPSHYRPLPVSARVRILLNEGVRV